MINEKILFRNINYFNSKCLSFINVIVKSNVKSDHTIQ